MPKIKLEHIDALSKGKKSWIWIGNRWIPHHLYAHERGEYERALKRGYLILDKSDRANLENLWILVCQTRDVECIILRKNHDRGIITSGSVEIFNWLLWEAKLYIKNFIKISHM